jgi:inhibitor of KinA
MRITAYGEDALLVNFVQAIEPELNDKVNLLANKLRNEDFITSMIPAYCSLTISYDPNKISFNDLKNTIEAIDLAQEKEQLEKRQLTIPVCYDDKFGIDLSALEDQLSITKDEIINCHSSTAYRVYMLGFLPGFPYMGITDEKIEAKRKENPRKKIEAGSVGLAGRQTGIYPFDSPGGWQIIGRTPIQIFEPQEKIPFLFKAGDLVNFKPVSSDEFSEIAAHIKEHTFNWEQIYG